MTVNSMGRAAAFLAVLSLTWVSGCGGRTMASTPSPAGDIPIFPVEKFTLSNGLRVVMSVDRSAPVVALDVYYHAGSKNETRGRNGYAHLFEHLMFGGSQHAPGNRHWQTISEGGGIASAWTQVDYTEYYNVFPANYLETALWLESDRMGFLVPALTMASIGVSRDIVNNERRQNYLNAPYGIEPIVMMPQVYPQGHPYSWRAIGYEEDLAKAQLEDVSAFFTRYYVPNNAVLCIVGDIDVAQTKALVEKYFGGLARGADVVQPAAPPAALASEKRLVLEDAKGVQPKISFVWPTGGVHDRDAASVAALSILLGGPPPRSDDRTARLSKLLIYDRKLATSVETNQLADELAGLFLVEIFARPGVSLTLIEQVVDSVMTSLRTTPMKPAEVERLKNYLIVGKISSMQSVFGKSESLGLSEVYFGDPHAYAKQLRSIMDVRDKDINSALTRFFSKGRVVLSLVPAGKLDLVSRPDLPYTNITPAAAPAAK